MSEYRIINMGMNDIKEIIESELGMKIFGDEYDESIEIKMDVDKFRECIKNLTKEGIPLDSVDRIVSKVTENDKII